MEGKQTEIWSRIGSNLRNCRQDQGLTQEELGNRLGVTRNYICSLEKGKCNPTVEKIWKISKTPGCKYGNHTPGDRRRS